MNDSSGFGGDIQIARQRFLRFAEAAAAHLPAEPINCLAWHLCVYLDSNNFGDWLEEWNDQRERERNGSQSPASDTEFLAFMRSIGATDARPRRKARQQAKQGTEGK